MLTKSVFMRIATALLNFVKSFILGSCSGTKPRCLEFQPYALERVLLFVMLLFFGQSVSMTNESKHLVNTLNAYVCSYSGLFFVSFSFFFCA
jgi:hypothetical protein